MGYSPWSRKELDVTACTHTGRFHLEVLRGKKHQDTVLPLTTERIPHGLVFLLSSEPALILEAGVMGAMGHQGTEKVLHSPGAAGGLWDGGRLFSGRGSLNRPGWPRGERVGALQSTDRLMAPALHTIEFALLSLLALGKGLSSWELSWTPRATGPRLAGPDWIRRNKGHGTHRQSSTQRGHWLSPIFKTQLQVSVIYITISSHLPMCLKGSCE